MPKRKNTTENPKDTELPEYVGCPWCMQTRAVLRSWRSKAGKTGFTITCPFCPWRGFFPRYMKPIILGWTRLLKDPQGEGVKGAVAYYLAEAQAETLKGAEGEPDALTA